MDKLEDDLQEQINTLKIKLEAAEAIHAIFIGMIVRFLPVQRETFLEEVRKSVRVTASAPSSTTAEEAKLLAEQFAQQAIDKIETGLKRLDRLG